MSDVASIGRLSYKIDGPIKKEILPLFSIPISLYKLDLDKTYQNKIEKKINSLSYRIIENGQGCISNDVHIFKNKIFDKLSKKIKECVNFYNDEVMQYESNDFEITTSWATKCDKNQESMRHKHSNNMDSAVYYNKCKKDHSHLTFFNQHYNPHGYELKPKTDVQFNAGNWSILPEDNLLVVFPSYLYHQIQKNVSDEPRFSIACNLRPTGKYGMSDSFIS